MLKLKLQYFGHLIGGTNSFEKTLILGKIEGGRRRGWQRMRWLDGITDSMDMRVWINSGSWWWTGRPGVLKSLGLQRVGHDWVTELILEWMDISCGTKVKARHESRKHNLWDMWDFFLHTKQWNTEVWSQIKRINSDQAMQSFLTKQPVDFLHFYISCDQRHWQSFTLDYFLIMFYNKKLWKVGEAVCF